MPDSRVLATYHARARAHSRRPSPAQSSTRATEHAVACGQSLERDAYRAKEHESSLAGPWRFLRSCEPFALNAVMRCLG